MLPRRPATRLDPVARDFVLGAVRSFATGCPCPAVPRDDQWVIVAERAGVLATVVEVLVHQDVALPASLRSSRFAAAATHLAAAVELRGLAGILGDAGVRWLVLKGPVLAQVVYLRPGARTYDDVDVLVHPDDLAEAVTALEADGYVVLDRNWALVARTARGEISVESPSGMTIDLHWHPVNDARVRASLQVDVCAMVDRRIVVDVDGLTVPTLDRPDTVLYVALHGCLAGGHELKWLLDLQQAVRWAGVDAETLRTRSGAHGVTQNLAVMARRAARYVDPSLTELADALGPVTGWAKVCRKVSDRAAPVGITAGVRSGRTVISSTRSSSARSARALVRVLVDSRRRRLRPPAQRVGVDTLHRAAGTEADRDRWFAAAATGPR